LERFLWRVVGSPDAEVVRPRVVVEQPPAVLERMRVAVGPLVVPAQPAVVAVHFLGAEEQLHAEADGSLVSLAQPRGVVELRHEPKSTDDQFAGWAHFRCANSPTVTTIAMAGEHPSSACSHFCCLELAERTN
jgi:hypothetical protein